MTDLRFPVAAAVALVVGLGTYAHGGGFAPPQGSGGGGGGVANPLTGDLDAASYLIQFGGTTSEAPAMRKHPSVGGVLEFLGGDGSDAPVILRGKDGGAGEAGASLYVQGGYGDGGSGAGGQIGLIGASSSGANGSVTVGSGGTPWATFDSSGLSLASGKAIKGGVFGFRLRKTADQTFTFGAETATWDTEDLDELGWIDLAGANTKILAAVSACEVDLIVRVQWAADADVVRYLIVERLNSSDVVQERWDSVIYHGESTVAVRHVMPAKIRMAAGDSLRVRGAVPNLGSGGSCAWDENSGTLANCSNAAYVHGTIRLLP